MMPLALPMAILSGSLTVRISMGISFEYRLRINFSAASAISCAIYVRIYTPLRSLRLVRSYSFRQGASDESASEKSFDLSKVCQIDRG